jgi:FtsP/CotA-like multicopper oxidase with cupredoxin domain
MPRASRPVLWAAGALALLAAHAASGAEDAPVVHELAIAQRAVAGESVVRVTEGDRVVLRWTTDEPAEIHLHGYDLTGDLVPGETTEMAFEAHATGRFPVTAHGFGEHGDDEDGHGHEDHEEAVLVYVEVYPR